MKYFYMIATCTGVAVLSLLLLAYGFVLAVQGLLHPEGAALPQLKAEEKSPSVNPDKLTFVGLGDSITRGIGDSRGLGYLGRVQEKLENDYDSEVSLVNMSVSGATSKDLLAQLRSEGIGYTVSQADVIIMSIGGNDLFPDWSMLEEMDLSAYQGNVETFRRRAENILKKIRDLNETVPVLWLGLYDPFQDIKALEGTSQVVRNWNFLMQKIAGDFSKVYVIPTYDLFQGETGSLLYSDHFHPNAQGYNVVAERVVRKLIHVLNLEREQQS